MIFIIFIIVFFYIRISDSKKSSEKIFKNDDTKSSVYKSLKNDLQKAKVSIGLISVNFDGQVLDWIADETTKKQLEKDIEDLISQYSEEMDKIKSIEMPDEKLETYRESVVDLMSAKLEKMNDYNKEIVANSSEIKKLSYYHSIESQYVSKTNEVFDDFIDAVEQYIK